MRFVNVEDTVWPVDEDGEVQWRLRYGFDRRDGDLSAASVMAAYAFLTDPNRTLKDATASLRRARAAVQKPARRKGEPPMSPEEEIVRAALAEVYRPEGVEIWMIAPHRSFGGLSATEMIDAGRADEVLAEIERLTTGAFS